MIQSRSLSALFLIGMLMLSACAGSASQNVSYMPPNAPGGRLCIGQCGEARNYCQQECGLKQRQCVGNVQTQALQDYDKYTREQFTHREPIELRTSDFERMAPCDELKRDCGNDCENHYQACYKNCGGTVDMTTSCQFLCF